MRPKTLFWIALLLLSSQMIQAQHAISFDIEKKLDAGKSAHVAALSTYDPGNPLSAGSLIEYEISIEEEEESYSFYHIQIKRVLFQEYGNNKAYLFDSNYPLEGQHVFKAQEALVGTHFSISIENRELSGQGFIQEIYEHAMGHIAANTRERDAIRSVYYDYFSEKLFKNHLYQMLGLPLNEQIQADVACKLLPEKPIAETTVITGEIDNSGAPDLKLKSVGLFIHGPLGQKREVELGEDRTFRFSFELAEPARIHLFVEGIYSPLILFIKPGDHLHAQIQPEKKDLQVSNFFYYDIHNTVEFIGDVARENTLLQDYIADFRSPTNWKYPRHGFNTNFLLKPSYTARGQTLANLQEAYLLSLDFLSEKGKGLEPTFLGFLETEIKYFYQLMMKGRSHEPHTLKDSLTLSFPELPDLFNQNLSYGHTEYSHWYQQYLQSYFKTKTINSSALRLDDHLSPLDKYHFISVVFQGYPKYYMQAEMLIESFRENSIRYHILEDLAEAFIESCQDERLTQAVTQIMERTEGISQGNPIPPFVLLDKDDHPVEINRWTGKPILLVFTNSFAREEISLLEEIHDQYPELELILVEHNHTLSSDKYKTIVTRKKNYESEVFIDFDASTSNLPGVKFPPQQFGRSELEALGVYGNRRYYTFLIDKNGILQSEWGDYLLDYPEYLRENINWIIYGDAHDSPWLSAEVLGPVAGGLVVLPILFVLLMRLYRRRTAQREAARRLVLERELKGIRAQLNPHFLFNAMGSIQNLVDSAQPEEANHYLSQFSSLMRQVLSHSQQEMIPLADEINLLNNYLELETLRHGFQWEISVDPNIDIHNTEVPSMMLQPYVENAILHGIAGMGAAGKVLIKIDKLNQQLLVTIEDNGMGIENAIALQGETIPQGTGLGMKLTQERMQKLGDRYGGDFRILLHDRMYDEVSSHGTRVEVWIPTEG